MTDIDIIVQRASWEAYEEWRTWSNRDAYVPQAIARGAAKAAAAIESRQPEHLRGDGPCAGCGTLNNIVWFTENKLWNEVVRPDGGMDAILCIPCFVVRADASGLKRGAWVLTPAAGLYEQVDVP